MTRHLLRRVNIKANVSHIRSSDSILLSVSDNNIILQFLFKMKFLFRKSNNSLQIFYSFCSKNGAFPLTPVGFYARHSIFRYRPQIYFILCGGHSFSYNFPLGSNFKTYKINKKTRLFCTKPVNLLMLLTRVSPKWHLQ